MAVGTDNRTRPSGADQDAQTINLLNNVVVGMIVLFAAVVVVNTFAAVVAHRRAELHRLWLLGATPAAGRGLRARRGRASSPSVGVVLGLLASLATIVPFGVARHEGVVPDGQLWLPVLVVAGVVALTLAGRPLAPSSGVRRVGAPVTDWADACLLAADQLGAARAGRRGRPRRPAPADGGLARLRARHGARAGAGRSSRSSRIPLGLVTAGFAIAFAVVPATAALTGVHRRVSGGCWARRSPRRTPTPRAPTWSPGRSGG